MCILLKGQPLAHMAPHPWSLESTWWDGNKGSSLHDGEKRWGLSRFSQDPSPSYHTESMGTGYAQWARACPDLLFYFCYKHESKASWGGKVYFIPQVTIHQKGGSGRTWRQELEQRCAEYLLACTSWLPHLILLHNPRPPCPGIASTTSIINQEESPLQAGPQATWGRHIPLRRFPRGRWLQIL